MSVDQLFSRGRLMALLAGLVPFVALAQWAEQDWPCVQRLVPEVAIGTLWPEPIDASIAADWERDAEVKRLAQRLGDGAGFDEQNAAGVDALLAATPASERRARLERLATGVVAFANGRRSQFIDGIRRYTRQQIAISHQIESTLNELAELDDSDTVVASAPGDRDRSDVEETLVWHERLYDQRERQIRALCEQPVRLEERLADAMRELAQRLPES